MRFSTVFSVLACGAMAMAAALTPAVLVSRSNADISKAVSDLSGKCDSILPLFGSCQEAGCTVALVGQIAAAIDEATTACGGLTGVVSPDIANEIADVILKVSAGLNAHQAACKGQCGDVSVYGKIDLSFSLWLKQLQICAYGVLSLVATLLVKSITILKAIGFIKVLEVCLLV